MPSFIQLALFLPAIASLAPEAAAHPRACKAQDATAATAGKAVYFLTNSKSNSVVALRIGQDGTLSPGSLAATGGAGSNSIDGSTGQPAVPDALVSQSALTVAGNVRNHSIPISMMSPLSWHEP